MLTGWVGDGTDELPISFVSLGSSTSLFLPTSLHPLSLPPCGSRRIPVWDVPPETRGVLRMPGNGVCFTSDQLSLSPLSTSYAGGLSRWQGWLGKEDQGASKEHAAWQSKYTTHCFLLFPAPPPPSVTLQSLVLKVLPPNISLLLSIQPVEACLASCRCLQLSWLFFFSFISKLQFV